MSTETRNKLVSDTRLVLVHASQKTDLTDPRRTNTWLIEFLVQLLNTAKHPIMLTAVYSDHAAGTLHRPSDGSPGRAVDLWHADWHAVGDDKIVDVMQAAGKISCAKKPALVEVGLSANAAYLRTYVTWCTDNVFVEDWGFNNAHCHFGVGTPIR